MVEYVFFHPLGRNICKNLYPERLEEISGWEEGVDRLHCTRLV